MGVDNPARSLRLSPFFSTLFAASFFSTRLVTREMTEFDVIARVSEPEQEQSVFNLVRQAEIDGRYGTAETACLSFISHPICGGPQIEAGLYMLYIDFHFESGIRNLAELRGTQCAL